MAFQISSGTKQGGTVCVFVVGSGTSSSSSCKKKGWSFVERCICHTHLALSCIIIKLFTKAEKKLMLFSHHSSDSALN